MRSPTSLLFGAILALALAACGSVPPPSVVRPPFAVESTHTGPVTWTDFADDLAGADVVYFGESHDDRDQHAIEHLLLTVMAARPGPVLLGLEMFQRPFQDALDDYVAGRIDEREMLRRTEYFERWRYDYTFYAPLWRLCRERGYRVVALNAPAEVSRKVGRSGLASLDDAERAAIAADVRLGEPAYDERVRAIMNGVHPMPEPQLTHMVEAQTVWDETMADSAARALEVAGPGARMLVVAGRFHVQGRNGIPDRVDRRLPGLTSRVVIGRTVGRAEDEPAWTPDQCDFVAVVSHETPRLGVDIEPVGTDDAAGVAGLRVRLVAPGGPADVAGLAPGDVITSVDRTPVRDRVDLRHVLDPRRIGDRLPLFAWRGGTEYSFDVTLRPVPTPPSQSAPAVNP